MLKGTDARTFPLRALGQRKKPKNRKKKSGRSLKARHRSPDQQPGKKSSEKEISWRKKWKVAENPVPAVGKSKGGGNREINGKRETPAPAVSAPGRGKKKASAVTTTNQGQRITASKKKSQKNQTKKRHQAQESETAGHSGRCSRRRIGARNKPGKKERVSHKIIGKRRQRGPMEEKTHRGKSEGTLVNKDQRMSESEQSVTERKKLPRNFKKGTTNKEPWRITYLQERGMTKGCLIQGESHLTGKEKKIYGRKAYSSECRKERPKINKRVRGHQQIGEKQERRG